MTQEAKRGRPPNNLTIIANIERVCSAAIDAAEARRYKKASESLLSFTKKWMDPRERNGRAGEACLSAATLQILKFCSWDHQPPPQALTEVFELLLGVGPSRTLPHPDLNRKAYDLHQKKWKAINFAAQYDSMKNVPTGKLSKHSGVDHKTAKKWKENPDFQAACIEERKRLEVSKKRHAVENSNAE